jgi:hypothetical protein
MSRIFRLAHTERRDSAIDDWLRDEPPELRAIAQRWFTVMRRCGDDVRESLHDGHPTACIGDAAFAYVDAFTSHVNIGFFGGSELDDPGHLLEGAGRFMRHVKLRPGQHVDEGALTTLIEKAYADLKGLLRAGNET